MFLNFGHFSGSYKERVTIKKCWWPFLQPDERSVTSLSGKDLNQPNEFWSKESSELYYNLLQGECQASDWKRYRHYYNFVGLRPGHKGFPCAFLGQGECFEFGFFTSKREMKLKGVIQFGRLTAGHNHG